MDKITFTLNIQGIDYGLTSDLSTYLENPDDFNNSLEGFVTAHTCKHEYEERTVLNKKAYYCKHCSYLKQYIEEILNK